jgi:hypothetical protein
MFSHVTRQKVVFLPEKAVVLNVCSHSMGIAGYVSVCALLYCMLVSTVFHYMAIFRCVGFFIYLRILLRCLFLRSHTLHVSHLCLFLCCFPSYLFVFSCAFVRLLII